MSYQMVTAEVKEELTRELKRQLKSELLEELQAELSTARMETRAAKGDFLQGQIKFNATRTQLNQEIDELRQKVAGYDNKFTDFERDTRQHIKNLYEDLDEKGLSPERMAAEQATVEEKVENLEAEVEKIEEQFAKTEEKTANKGDILAKPLEYELDKSLWDAAAMIGFPCTGIVNSLILLLGVIINLAIQLLFCMVVLQSMSESTISEREVAGARMWRGSTGHEIQFADQFTRISLVAQICGEESSSHFSAEQYELFGDVYQLLHGELDGRFLGCLALVMWACAIIDDMQHNFKFTYAIYKHTAGFAEMVWEGEELRISSYSRLQLFLTLAVSTFPRFAISGLLGYVGVRFLALFTFSLNDLLLNAMALAFVLEIDELLFPVIVPISVVKQIQQTQPILIDPMRSCLRGGHVQVFFKLLLIGCIVFVINITYMEDHHSKLEEVADMLCGGDRDFVVTQNKATGGPIMVPTPAYYKGVNQNVKGWYTDSVIAHAFRDSEHDNLENIRIWELLTNIYQGDIADSAARLVCTDHLPFTDELYSLYGDNADGVLRSTRSALRQYDASLTSCKDVDLNKCFRYGGIPLRAGCPASCGCDNPWEGNIYAIQKFGCPLRCDPLWNKNVTTIPSSFKQYINSQIGRCEDVPADVLQTDPGFLKYLDGVDDMLIMNQATEDTRTTINGLLMKSGCAELSKFKQTLDLCRIGISELGRSIRPWCPVTCSCSQKNNKECACVPSDDSS